MKITKKISLFKLVDWAHTLVYLSFHAVGLEKHCLLVATPENTGQYHIIIAHTTELHTDMVFVFIQDIFRQT